MPIENTGMLLEKSQKIKQNFKPDEYTGETTLQDYAYKQIKKWIEVGNIKGGERIKEGPVSKKLNISRVPVREAALRLQSEGILKSLPRGGFMVPQYTPQEICKLYEMREAIEGMSARLAAENATDLDIYKLKDLNDQMSKFFTNNNLSENFKTKRYELDNDFHCQVIKASKNPYALQMLTLMNSRIIAFSGEFFNGEVLTASKFSKGKDRTIEVHQAIVDALFDRDPDRAENIAREHVRISRTNFKKFADWIDEHS